MVQQNIAVIGGGAKAAAIAAKAYCLRQIGFPISVTIFERHAVGAAWSGKHGYTHGNQRLCTPAERDLGYPYQDLTVDGVAEAMQREFSWAAFKIATKDGDISYADWVNRGRRPPFHTEFSEYLSWAVGKSEADLQIGTVTELRVEDDTWSVALKTSVGAEVVPGFHAVVVTGPGPASKYFAKPADPRIFDGVSFWSRLDKVRKIVEGGGKRAVIIGGGGTAAATASWMVQNCDLEEIIILNSQPTLFTRTLNFFESRLFDDDASWRALSPTDRASFTNRLNRGVVWETVTEILSNARELSLVPGRASSVEAVDNEKGGKDLVIRYSAYAGNDLTMPADIVVDATGFDPTWFRVLLKSTGALPDLTDIQENMRNDLSIDYPGPPLHAPMLSQVVGPGFASLMSLGLMSEAVLTPYIKASEA